MLFQFHKKEEDRRWRHHCRWQSWYCCRASHRQARPRKTESRYSWKKSCWENRNAPSSISRGLVPDMRQSLRTWLQREVCVKDVSSGHMSGLNDTATLVTGLRICLGTRRKTSRGYKLSPMCSYSPIKVSAGQAFLCLSLVCVACDRDTKPDTKDLATTPLPEATVKQFLSRNTGWDESSAGPFMLLSVPDDPVNAALVLPQETDSTLSNTSTFQLDAFSNVSVDLFGTSRTAGKSSVAVNAQQLPCLLYTS